MIVFDRVSKRYPGGQDALLNISFRLGRGEMAFLTGHSGAGKSTLLKLIMAMETASGGRIEVGGRDISQLRRNQVAFYRRHVGVVFQEHHLLFNRTVFDNVAMPLRIAGFTPRETARRVRAALDKVGLLNKEKAYPLELSGGEQQRVGIARAVVNRPPLLLADEPTGNLDPDLSAEIMRLFRDFNQVGTTVFVASHDIALIERMGCRVVHLVHGRLVTGSEA